MDFVSEPVADLQTILDDGFPPDAADLFHRGARCLADKEGFSQRLQVMKLKPPPYSPLRELEFRNLINDFWYHTVWTGKHVRRGELWWARSCCDGFLKNLLRSMLE